MTTPVIGDNARAELMAIAARINGLEDEVEKLKGEAAKVKDQIKDEKQQAASKGFDKRALDRVLKELRMDADTRQGNLELEVVTDLYRKALDLPTHEDLIAEAARKRINEAREKAA